MANAWNKGLSQFPTKDSFFKNTCIDVKTNCLIWTGKCDAKGYGKVYYRGQFRAHRIAWILTYGTIPHKLHVLHKCDNPPCVNPDHLYVGTNKDNVRDKVNRGRLVLPCNKGEANGMAILNISQVNEIKNANRGTIKELAGSFGVSPQTAYAIRAGARWNYATQ